jgi:hypothetical protein
MHGVFELDEFLITAYQNFKTFSQQAGYKSNFTGVLCLTEDETENGFDRLYLLPERKIDDEQTPLKTWYPHRTEEKESLYLNSDGEEKLLLIAGRQIVTREKLEVLAIGTRHKFENGKPIMDTLNEITECGAIPVIPWGFGKWMGARKKILQNILQNRQCPCLFVGDNGNRLDGWFKSPLFKQAESVGIRNLPGSDPLPFASEYRRAGNFGCLLYGSLNPHHPAKDIKEKLLNPSTKTISFGNGEKLLKFLRNQIGMQYLKWRSKKTIPVC